jgi:O-acetyl-ADP-ribose deacetylase (regulator of RNase III)
MSIVYKTGDLLDSGCDYICHQVNCQGKMNSGIAKQIREKWPIVYDEYAKAASFDQHGHIQLVHINDAYCVINMFAQRYYGYDGRRYTSYDAFWTCLGEIKNFVPKGSSIGFPKKIGCDRGGANWNVIECMIKTVLEDEYEIEIWSLA